MQLNLGLHAFHSAIGGGRKCVVGWPRGGWSKSWDSGVTPSKARMARSSTGTIKRLVHRSKQ